LDVELDAITRHFDTVSICLSKGLGAPAGSVLCGSREFIARAHRWRKVTGGGMRQAGILAAAGIHALEHHVARLAEDHANAAALAEGLATITGLVVQPAQTNMVFVTLPATIDQADLLARLRQTGVLLGAGNPLRLVTHLDISTADVTTVIRAFQAYFQ